MEQMLENKSTRDIVESFVEKTPKVHSIATIIRGIEKVLSYAPYKTKVDQNELDIALKNLIGKYFLLDMCKSYQLVDSKIFGVTKALEVKRDYSNEKYGLELPIFARAIVGETDEWTFKREINYKAYGDRFEQFAVEVRSDIPFLPDDVRAEGRQAKAYAHQAYARALQQQTLGDVLLSRPDLHPDASQAKLEVLWKPRPQDLKISVTKIRPDPDPILLLVWNNNPYLVHTWNESGEEPFLDMLRKFMGQKTLDDALRA
ncbi:MAG: hypothetical protein HYT16_00340 [DPANN group archaeon]|nr:hypothetical protein [DPANN group archaeon]